ncbi:MAG TPA: AtpZ/AtpI family protein [Dissulfurispiraceae bacterium]|nr:AtpZ/AtpI family protein [Dissulfurispiraceae bacterium]
MTDPSPEKPAFRQIFEASTVGIHLVLCIIAGALVGYGLDHVVGSFPYLSLIFFVLGIVAGFREVFRIARKSDRDSNGSDDSPHP